MRNILEKTNTLVEFVDKLSEYYDLRNCTPSKMIKQMLTTAITTAINIQDRNVIDAAINSVSLFDYLQTFAAYYDSINKVFSFAHKHAFITKIKNVVTITSCKKIK